MYFVVYVTTSAFNINGNQITIREHINTSTAIADSFK